MTAPTPKRCAIYTRKSTEEGLEQSFNSLHAQREACEAYVLSQAGEGWTVLPEIYDDPAYSGGNMDRPALTRLLSDIRAGQIDTVVVYKVDRLTRSLADFAKIVETFDQSSASFVSVTQAFNTTSSMGRLTLNVLLSFAQFEREVTGERIRDKIAASKAKGMWMGGNPPLGYDPQDRTLVVNEPEAKLVRHIFQRYLSLKSVHRLEAELRSDGARSKSWTTTFGAEVGGRPFSRGALFHLLKNPVYVGRIPHKDRSFPGNHPAIIAREVFDRVEAQLAENRVAHRDRPLQGDYCLLKGKVFNDAQELMSPAIAYGKKGQVFRYYVATSIQRGRTSSATIRRVAAAPTEAWVNAQLERIFGINDPGLSRINRLDLGAESTAITFEAEGLDETDLTVTGRSRLGFGERIVRAPSASGIQLILPVRLQLRGGRSSINVGHTGRRADPKLVAGLCQGHQLLNAAGAGPEATMTRQARSRAITNPYEQALTRLALLAPDIQLAILEGAQPKGLSLTKLVKNPPPLDWNEQRRLFGFVSSNAGTD